MPYKIKYYSRMTEKTGEKLKERYLRFHCEMFEKYKTGHSFFHMDIHFTDIQQCYIETISVLFLSFL